MAYKPSGYTSVAPYLIVTDAEVALRFIEQTFAGQRLLITPPVRRSNLPSRKWSRTTTR